MKSFFCAVIPAFTFIAITFAAPKPISHQQTTSHIHIITVSGDDFTMGQQYGEQMQTTLQTTLTILKTYYITQHHLTHHDLVTQSQKLYNRFPASLQNRIQGEAQGANISLNDAIILNGMETLGTLLNQPTEHCAFAFLPPTSSATDGSLIGRNYDYSEPFDKIAPYLTVTVFKKAGAVPTASIALPGEMYCPNCVNANGIFLELNNGSPSGGSTVNTSVSSLLAKMQTNLEQAHSLNDLTKKLDNLPADFSLIINAADKNRAESLEFSSTLGMKTHKPTLNQSFVSTNYFLDPTWENIPKPNDTNTWKGITRRNNLLKLMTKQTSFNTEGFKALMNRNIINGGGKWLPTIYQIIFDTKNETLYLKTKSMNDWQQINLIPLFKQ